MSAKEGKGRTIQAAIVEKLAEQRFAPEREIAYDVVFVLNVTSRGWILEKICKIIAEQSNLHYTMVYSERSDRVTVPLPLARAYFFSHYKLYVGSLAQHSVVASALRFVWFTHPDFDKFSEEEVVFALKHATGVFTANATHRKYLARLGVDEEKLHTVLGGADPAVFRSKPRGRGLIAFVGACYERKSPDLMLEVIRRMPDCRFLLIGPSPKEVENRMLLWSNWPRFRELEELPHLEIVDPPYQDYPRFYDRTDVFVSLSTLEGGPIALIEAMFSNAVPVVTRTGFAEDVIRDGHNGRLLPTTCTADQVERAIRSALRDRDTDVSATCQHLSWASFGQQIADKIMPALRPGSVVDFSHLENCVRLMREGWNRKEAAGCAMLGRRARLLLPVTGQEHCALRLRFKLKTIPGVHDVAVTLRISDRVATRAVLAAGQTHTLTCNDAFSSPVAEPRSVWLELDAIGTETEPQLRLEALSLELRRRPTLTRLRNLIRRIDSRRD